MLLQIAVLWKAWESGLGTVTYKLCDSGWICPTLLLPRDTALVGRGLAQWLFIPAVPKWEGRGATFGLLEVFFFSFSFLFQSFT